MSNGAEIVASKIIQFFKSPFNIEGEDIFISSSLGIAIFPDDGTDIETLIQNADKEMYQSKQQGHN